MSHNTHCLNCGKDLHDNYCSNCGQSAATHRFSLKHIFTHDLVHNLFHIDRGILFTVKELFTRPGHMVREYIEGKRAKQFNYITLLLVLITIQIFITHSTGFTYADIASGQQNTEETKVILNKVQQLQEQNMKLIYLFFIPFTSLSTFLFFRRSGKNYAENLVMNTYEACASLIFNIVATILFVVLSHNISSVASYFIGFLTVVYSIWFFTQFYSPFYENKSMLILRVVAAKYLPIIIVVLIIILVMLAVGPEKAITIIKHYLDNHH